MRPTPRAVRREGSTAVDPAIPAEPGDRDQLPVTSVGMPFDLDSGVRSEQPGNTGLRKET